MHMPENTGGDFTPTPAGTHIARCYQVIDLGTQKTTFNNEEKQQHKIQVGWELPGELMEDGKPFSIRKWYTFSSHEKANLRHDLESWRGRAFEEKDFGPGGFNIKNVLGVPCLLTVIHTTKDNKTYSNISSIAAPMKGLAIPPAVNAPVYFCLQEGEYDADVFRSLSDNLRTKIMNSPEWQAAEQPNGGSMPDDGFPGYDQSPTGDDDLGSEIPF